RQPGIVGLHALTTANALHYAWSDCGEEQGRRLALLQACAFVPLFLGAAQEPRRGKVKDMTIDDLKPVELKADAQPAAIEEIFADVSGNRMDAAGKILAWLEGKQAATDLIDAARRLIFLKGRDAHDYKFSSAVLEDYYHVSPEWRNQFMATSVFNLRGSGERDNGLVERTRAALA
ncbi:MAG: hypothetical protein ACREJB_15020, partial [Planctomycetaceae bacterium]